MLQTIEESLLQAIKSDNVKAFDAIAGKVKYGACRLGRFPVLSLLYLYKSRRILAACEERLLQISTYEVLREPIEVSKKFSGKAGKCLRLYLDEVVSPLEMLLILDKTKRIKQVYPIVKPPSAVRSRLKAIYSIKYSLSVKFEGENIVIDRRPLSYREKRNIATVCLSVILALIIVIGVPVTTVSLIPKPVEGEVTELVQIDFEATKEYVLKQDIILPENYSVKKISCAIKGGGGKLILGKGVTLGELTGSMSNLTIESKGDTLFTSISANGVLENVTVNVNADVVAAEGTAFVAATNYGTIDGVTVNASGKINAVGAPTSGAQELTFGGIVQNNSYVYISALRPTRGNVKNCTVNYSHFELVGDVKANATFGGVAGINSGFVQDCNVTGDISADTFDIAGICSVNNYLLSNNVNNANISQKSSAVGWQPVVCGIVVTNAYAVENCENTGKLSAGFMYVESATQENNDLPARVAGIAYVNKGVLVTAYILNCTNTGDIVCNVENRSPYAAGICVSSNGTIESCKNLGLISAKANNSDGIYVGGIAAIAFENIYKSVNQGAVVAEGDCVAYIGGIASQSSGLFSNCYSSGDISVTAKTAYAGGILGFSGMTSRDTYVYCGNVDSCISKGNIRVSLYDLAPSYVGGVVGYVLERRFNNGDYFGGYTNNTYFTGKCESDISYFGGIVGVCGVNIYQTNALATGTDYIPVFKDNCYVKYSDKVKAFGATVTEDGGFSFAEDKGATPLTAEEIENSEEYKSILNTLELT